MPHMSGYGWQPPQFPMQQPQRPTPLLPEEPEAPGPEAPTAPGDEGYMPTAEELALLAKLGIDPDMLEENARQQKAAEAASMTPLPEGRQVGSSFVAANPLEHLAALGQRAGGLYRGKKLKQERQGLLDEEEKALKARYGVGFKTYGYPSPFEF